MNPVQVEGNFPANFDLSFYEPPADNLINEFQEGEVGFAVANIIAYVPGVDWVADEEDEVPAAALGADEHHVLVYVPEDVSAGSYASYRLRSTPKAGFHIYGVYRPTEEEKAARLECANSLTSEGRQWYIDVFEKCGGISPFDDFVPFDTDLDTPLHIQLIDDVDQIEWSNWT